MKEQLIRFETAKLAKDKGFNKNTDWHVNIANEYHFGVHLFYPNNSEYTYDPENDPEVIEHEEFLKTLIKAPTQSLLQKWLREEHKLHFHIYYGEERKWCLDIYSIKDGIEEDYCAGLMNNPNQFTKYPTYELVLEAGLFEALKLIKQ